MPSSIKVQRALRSRTEECMRRLAEQPHAFYGVVAASYPYVQAFYLKLDDLLFEAYGDRDYQEAVLSYIRPERHENLPILTFSPTPLAEVWLEPYTLQDEDETPGIRLIDTHERVWVRFTWRGLEDLTEQPVPLAS